jgi:hypothetical protein
MEVGDGVDDAHTFANCHDADFALEKIDVEFEEFEEHIPSGVIS